MEMEMEMEIQPTHSKHPTLNPLSQALFFNLSAFTELLPLSHDPKIKLKSTKTRPLWPDS
jgi:hypothetical protein